jgi:hypothetical protein
MPRSLSTPGAVDDLIDRLRRLTPETSRRWGTMTAHEMLCHLADSFRGVMGERSISTLPASALRRNVTRLIALHAPLRWPRGIPTRPEVDPKREGTRPTAFDADRDDVISLLRRFAAPAARCDEHPVFGAMSRSDWLIWGYRHLDHHLRQFGV